MDILDSCSKNTQISDFMTMRSVGAELFHADLRTDGRTDRHDESKSCFSQFYERAEKYTLGFFRLHNYKSFIIVIFLSDITIVAIVCCVL